MFCPGDHATIVTCPNLLGDEPETYNLPSKERCSIPLRSKRFWGSACSVPNAFGLEAQLKRHGRALLPVFAAPGHPFAMEC